MLNKILEKRVVEMDKTIKHNLPKVKRKYPNLDPALQFSLAKYWDCLNRLARE